MVGRRALGVRSAPAGTWNEEYKFLKSKADRMGTVVRINKFGKRDNWTAYHSIYRPGMRYSLVATTFDFDECRQIQSKAVSAFLNGCGYNRNFPRALVFRSPLFGGTGFQHLHFEQGLAKVEFIFRSCHYPSELGDMVLIALDTFQLLAGRSQYVWEHPELDCSYATVEGDWVQSVREFLAHVNCTLHLKKAWKPKHQRVNDRFLMDQTDDLGFSNNDLIKINRCRVYLQVLTLADITSGDGQHLLPGAMAGNREQLQTWNTPNLRWPRQAKPDSSHWRLWRRLLRSFLQPSRAHSNRRLQQPLGRWLLPSDSMYRQWIFWTNETTLWICTPHHWLSTTDLQLSHRTITAPTLSTQHSMDAPPPDTHPITPRETTTHWTWERSSTPHHMAPSSPPKFYFFDTDIALHPWEYELLRDIDEEHGFSTENLISALQSNSPIYIVSDASVSHDNQGRFGWVVATETEILWRGNGPVGGLVDLLSSFRAEMYGALAAFLFIKYFRIAYLDESQYPIDQITSINYYCDNKGVIRRIQRQQTGWTVAPFDADADVELLLGNTLRAWPAQIIARHVKGHQDTVNLQRPLTWPERLNVEADDLATHARIQSLFLPSPVQLRSRNGPVTSKHKSWLHHASTFPSFQRYVCHKYSWPTSTFRLIQWRLIGKAMNGFPQSDKTRIQKAMHNWLPTNQHLCAIKYKDCKNAQCPRCSHPSESNLHLLCCNHPGQREVRSNWWQRWNQWHDNNHTEPQLRRILTDTVESWLTNNDHTVPLDTIHRLQSGLDSAIHDQNDIGWTHFMCGRIASKFNTHQHQWLQRERKLNNTHNGELWSIGLTRLMWQLFLQSWRHRNDIFHGKDATEQHQRALRKAIDTIEEYYQDAPAAPADDRSLFDIPLAERIQGSLQAMQAWIAIFEKVRPSWGKTAQSRATQYCQRIDRYFSSNASITV